MSKVKVVGFKRFEGRVDNSNINSAKLFIEVKLDGSRNSDTQRSEGVCTEEVKVPPALLKRIEHTPLPFFVELETERVSNGREARDQVIGLQLVDAAASKGASLARAA